MPPRPQVVRLPFGAGLRTDLAEKSTPDGVPTELQDFHVTEEGALSKRYGFTELGNRIIGGVTEISSPSRLAKRGSELVLLADNKIYSYDSNRDQWADRGSLPLATARSIPSSRTSDSVLRPDALSIGDYVVTAWEASTSGRVWVAVVRKSDGATIVPPRLLAGDGGTLTARNARLVRVGANAVLVYDYQNSGDSTQDGLYTLYVSPDAPEAAETRAPVFISSDYNSVAETYDVKWGMDAGFLVWAGDTSSVINMARIGPDGTIWNSGHGASIQDPTSFSLAAIIAGGGYISCDCWHSENGNPRAFVVATLDNSNNFEIHGFDSDWSNRYSTAVVGSAGIQHFVVGVNEGTVGGGWIWTNEIDSGSNDEEYYVEGFSWAFSTSGSNFTGAPGAFTDIEMNNRGVHVKTCSTWWSGAPYLIFGHETQYYSSEYLVRGDTGEIVARIGAGSSKVIGLGSNWLRTLMNSTITDLDTGAGALTNGYGSLLEYANIEELDSEGVRFVGIELNPSDPPATAESGQTLYVTGGGLVWAYDGEGSYEATPHFAPDRDKASNPPDIALELTSSNSTGSLENSGVYSYKAIYVLVNAQGEIVRSAPSIAAQITLGASDDTVTVEIPPYGVGKLKDRSLLKIELYRTTDKGSTYYRTSDALGISNSIANATISYTDETSDSDLLERPTLYTEGGVFAAEPLDTGSLLAEAGERLWVNGLFDGNVLYYSNRRTPGVVPEFHQDKSIVLPSEGGEPTAFARLATDLVVFKRYSLYVITGEGPDNVGLNGIFADPVKLPSDAGCINPRSVRETPAGIVFQAQQGLYMLSLDRSVQYIGAPVDRYLSPQRDNLTIAAADNMPDRHEVRFICSDGDALTYNYGNGQWGTATRHTGIDSIVVDNDYYYLRSNGEVLKENRSSYQHGELHIQPSVTLPWIELAGDFQSLQKIWWATITGTYRTAHKLRVYVGVDYENEWVRSLEVDPANFIVNDAYGAGPYGAGPYGSSNEHRYQARFYVGRKCRAIRFRIDLFEDSETYGAAGDLEELTVIGGVLTRSGKLPSARSS